MDATQNGQHRMGEDRHDLNTDPASGIQGMPPNLGDWALRHTFTFVGIAGSQAKVYRPSDEAIRDSFDNAQFMRNDITVMECVEMRQRAVALLDWSIEPEDAQDAEQVAVADTLTKILKKIPRFMQYRENLLHATWYGKYGIQHKWGYRWVAGKMRPMPLKWLPVSGDKIVYRYDDGMTDHRPDQIGIRVGAGIYSGPDLRNSLQNEMKSQGFRGKIESTDHGLAYFLDTWERTLLAVHKYRIEDGEYHDPSHAGRIHGVGVRSVLYWTWYQKQETLANLMEFLERSATGTELWYYPMGNKQAHDAMEKAAQEKIGNGRNIVLVPRPLGEDGQQYGVEHVEPGMAGAEQIKSIITEYFGHAIKRYILGQTLTTEASATGLGSSLADIHLDTFMQIVRYDAMLLEETITTDLLDPLKKLGFPKHANVDYQIRIHTREPDADQIIEAMMKAYDMGLRLDAQQLRDLIGSPKPEKDAEVLDKMEQMKAEQEAAQPPPEPGGMPPGNMMAPGSSIGAMNGDQQAGVNGDAQSAKNSAPAEATEQAEYVANGNPSENSDRQRLVGSDDQRVDHYRRFRYDGETDLDDRIDKAASETDTNPSDKQREAGNYRKGRFHWNGLELVIETPRGVKRRPEWPAMPAHYGYIRRFESEADGDHIDIFIGPKPDSELVFVVDQVTPSGRFDEHKVVLGCISAKEADTLYREAYTSGWKVGKITPMTVSQFLTWLENGDSSKPIEKQVAAYAADWNEPAHKRGQGGQFVPDLTGWDVERKQEPSLPGQTGLFSDVDPGLVGAAQPTKKAGAKRDPNQRQMFFRRQVQEALRG